MAIVFVSPKQRQKMFFLGITIMFLLFLSAVGAAVFFSKPAPTPVEQAFIRPKIEINLKVLDSEQVKGSLIMVRMQKEFVYSAKTDKGVKKAGSVFAATMDEARKKIEEMELIIIDLEEVEIGRENPFAPYYTITNAKK